MDAQDVSRPGLSATSRTNRQDFMKKAFDATERMLGLVNDMLACQPHPRRRSTELCTFKDTNIVKAPRRCDIRFPWRVVQERS
jgi:hypothetical protein